ncbi:geraniol 8-hydroxylase-like [Lycium barbarum]|uniref:geraniol 8-hydroxylase-like n=1 Tax=Lycium barbarum TaxID=112863 RepID=UPI00293F5BB0|nr:geraniol 8-hydroxylase-like [Lycium barbarum]
MDYYYTTLLALLLAWTLIQGFTLLLALLPTNRSRKLPPGPFPLPIIGNLHLLGNQPHESFARLANFHGPIMRLKLGQITTVVISSSDIARQVFQKQDLVFSSRSIPDMVQTDNFHMFSVSWLPSVSPQWRNLRKVLNAYIFSVNKLDASQHLRYKKIQELVVYCQRSSQIGEAVDIGGAIFRTLLNLLSNTLFSKDLADPNVNSGKEFKDLVEEIMMDLGKPNLVDYFPLLKIVDPQGLRRYNSRFGKLLNIFNGMISERLELRKLQNDQKTDVLDALITATEQRPKEIDLKHIATICLDLFVAGTDTSSNIVEWAMAEILKAPKIMKIAQAELAEVIGEGKAIDEADVARLPYLQCIIKEAFRLHPPAPFLVPRKVEQDVEVCGYTVPKGSKVLTNVWAIGRDPTLWEDPLIFNPDRFKDSKLDVRGRDFELIPFGAGRRICPGLPLAIRMVPVMLGTLLNTFKWKIEGDIAPKDLDMQEKFGLTLAKLRPLRAIPLHLPTPKDGFLEKAMD